MYHKNTTKSGFTLVEMLVVITILAILAALLIPGIGLVQEKGKNAQSVNNLRQIGIGMQSLISEGVPGFQGGSGQFPSRQGSFNDPNGSVQYTWMDLVGQQLGFIELEGTDWVYKIDPKKSIFQNPRKKANPDAPELKDFNPETNATQQQTASYGINRRLASWSNEVQIGASSRGESWFPAIRTRFSSVDYPARLAVVVESNGEGVDDFTVLGFGGIYQVFQDNKGGCNALFADWHVEWMRSTTPVEPGNKPNIRLWSEGHSYFFDSAQGKGAGLWAN
ncbi:MAG: prepilin-type N-terminal cleavage/methylation domain-containing protein [Verrucomicrobiota bacterium]